MTKKLSIDVSGALILALVAAWAVTEPGPDSVGFNLCRTDAELAKLPKDHMSQQRCGEPWPFGG